MSTPIVDPSSDSSTPPPLQSQQPRSGGFWKGALFILGFIGFLAFQNQDQILCLISTKVEIREVVSPQKQAVDIQVWQNQQSVLNEQVATMYQKYFNGLTDATPVKEEERTAKLDLITKLLPVGEELDFWDGLKCQIATDGLRPALETKLPPWLKIYSMAQIAVTKLGENQMRLSYHVRLMPLDTVFMVPVKNLTEIQPELSKYSGIVNKITLQSDLALGNVYQYARKVVVAKVGEPIDIIWSVRQATKGRNGWVITETDPVLFTKEFEQYGDQSYRLRPASELVAQVQFLQAAMGQLNSRIAEVQKGERQIAQQNRRGSSQTPTDNKPGFDFWTPVKIGLDLYNALK